MAQKHTIAYLPADVRERVDRFLSKQQRTVDEFHTFLTEDLGLDLSRSSSHRYMQGFEQAAAKLRQSRQVASAFAEQLGEDSLQSRQGRVLVEMFQTLVQDLMLQRLQDGEAAPAFDTKDFMQLGRAIKDAMSASKIDVDREAKIREEERKKVEKETAERVEAAAARQGLTAETKAAFMAEVFGDGE